MQNCIDCITSCLLKHDIISENDVDIFRYGLEKRLSTFLIGIPFFLLAVFLIGPLPAGAFFLGFFFLRSKTNGFHAKSTIGCMALSLLMEFVFTIGIFPLLSTIPNILIGLLCTVCVFQFAPYVHPNLPLSQAEIAVIRRQARIRVLGLVFTSWLTELFHWDDFSNGIILGMAMDAFVLCLPSLIKKGGSCNGETKRTGQFSVEVCCESDDQARLR